MTDTTPEPADLDAIWEGDPDVEVVHGQTWAEVNGEEPW